MTTRVRASKLLAVVLLSLSWGCGASDLDAPQRFDAEGEELGTSSEALVASGAGTTYASQCAANGVPLPPKFGQSTVLPPGSYDFGKWTEQPGFTDSYVDFRPGKVYTSKSIQASQEGLCVIAAHNSDSGPQGVFDVICQGKNGKACFWEKTTMSQLPPADPVYLTSLDGGTALTAHATCTACHAGKNVFIAHYNATNDGLNGLNDAGGNKDGWMPTTSSWYTPIVPAGWPENPPANNAGYPAACTSCHKVGGAPGPFPPLRTAAFAGDYYCKLLERVVSIPAAQGGMPPTSSCSSRNASDCPIKTDPQVKAMLAACGKPNPPAQAVSFKGSPVAVIGASATSPYSGSWDHLFVGTDIYSTSKMYLFDNVLGGGGAMSGWSNPPSDYTSILLSYYRPTMWLKDNAGSKLALASTDSSGRIWEKEFGAGAGLRTVNSTVMAAGSPFGYVRYNGTNTIVYRGTDNYIYEASWSGSAWVTNQIPGQVLKASGDPVAYNRASSSSIIYKCDELLCELRVSIVGWSFRVITTVFPLKGSTMPSPFRLGSSGEYAIFYAGEDGLRMITDSNEPAFGKTSEVLVAPGLITSAPAPYTAQDGGIRVAYIADYGSGNFSYVQEAVRPSGSTTWTTYMRQVTNNNHQQFTGDPVAYKASNGRNTIIFRNTANTIYQIQTTSSGTGDVAYAKTTIQKGYNIDTSGSVTQGQEATWQLWVPPGQYKYDLAPGSGDPDLYVKVGTPPTTASYDCRPYSRGATAESCTVTVPGPNWGYVNVMVRGFASGTSSYSLKGYLF